MADINTIVRDVIMILGTGIIITQIFKASGEQHFATLMNVATWTSAAYPFMQAVKLMANSSFTQGVVKVFAWIGYILGA